MASRWPPGAVLSAVFGMVTPALMFLGLALWIRTQGGAAWDLTVFASIQAHRTPVLNVALAVLTNLGSAPVVTGTALYLASELFRFRQFREGALVLSGVGGAGAAGVLLKHVFQRPTMHLAELSAGYLPPLVEPPGLPSLPLLFQTVYSFPSNHTVGITALGLVAALLAWSSRWRWPVAGLALLFVLVVGVSRVYLRVHYPTDVLAGWALGTAWVMMAWKVTRSPQTQRLCWRIWNLTLQRYGWLRPNDRRWG